MFDTVGLGRQVQAAGLRQPTHTERTPTFDFITRYGIDGAVSRSGVWQSAVSEDVTIQLTAMLASRILPLKGLLKPEGFHTRLTLAPWPSLALAPAIVCSPHMVHGEGQSPIGLPDSVRTWVGTIPRQSSDSSVSVTIAIDASGQVTDLTKRRGSDAIFDAARTMIANLVFNPAVRNGEAVDGELRQVFEFSRAR